MISKKEVKHVAKLARLGLKEKEIQKMEKELSKILDYIGKLKEVDISNVEPTRHSILIENVMRKDQESSTLEVRSLKLLELAPERKNGYFKTKSILK